MRKAILTILLAVMSSGAAAAWERVGANKELTGYADAATIRRTGNMVQMWTLLDYKTAQVFDGKPFLSVSEQFEFNCKDNQLQLLSVFAHSEHLAKGKIIYSATFDYEEWQPVRRGTVNQDLWDFACAKR